jgi:hypothetical protein
VLVTALGVGANAAAFSVADFVLVRPLPFPNPDALVLLRITHVWDQSTVPVPRAETVMRIDRR